MILIDLRAIDTSEMSHNLEMSTNIMPTGETLYTRGVNFNQWTPVVIFGKGHSAHIGHT